VLERQFRDAAFDYISEHPLYVGEVAFWSSARMLDVAGRDWSRHTTSTIGVGEPGWADAGVICFWVFAALAFAGAWTRLARRAPAYFWAVPALLYLSVVFLVVETPRYRTAIDPFVVILAALALARLLSPAHDGPHGLPDLLRPAGASGDGVGDGADRRRPVADPP
jgi:hypothetical protein